MAYRCSYAHSLARALALRGRAAPPLQFSSVWPPATTRTDERTNGRTDDGAKRIVVVVVVSHPAPAEETDAGERVQVSVSTAAAGEGKRERWFQFTSVQCWHHRM